MQSELEQFFSQFRAGVVGGDQNFESPYGEQKLAYADWTASGRLYRPIEETLLREVAPWVGNTHSEASITGTLMTEAYNHAQEIIKRHVNASSSDVLISAGSGMTHVINKFQRMLGLRVPDQLRTKVSLPESERPVVFLTHMEHHSNHTSWLETLADVVVLEPDHSGLVSLISLETQLKKFQKRKFKIGSFTACSNVTGIQTPYHELARIMHQNGGYCFVDFACSAPYVKIDMHPPRVEESLDAIFISPHKFLGGPGTPGIMVFNSSLYHSRVPDQPGGGTVAWTNPWGEHRFVESIEAREDGGTPPFLQMIKAGLAVKLKERMGSDRMLAREKEVLPLLFEKLSRCSRISILADQHRERLPVISFYVHNAHYNLIVKLLNDRFGIQVRGGCSCAGTYGHYLLEVDPTRSHQITNKIDGGDLSEKPGWVRASFHPLMSTKEVSQIADAIVQTAENFEAWAEDYTYSPVKNEFFHRSAAPEKLVTTVKNWFELP